MIVREADPWIQHDHLHNWRLIDEKPHLRVRHVQPKIRSAPTQMIYDETLVERRWYCTRCRKIETTVE